MKNFFIIVFVLLFSVLLCTSIFATEVIETEPSLADTIKETITVERVTTAISTIITCVLSVVIGKLTKALGLSKEVNTKEILNTVENAVNTKVKEGLSDVVKPLQEDYKQVTKDVHALIKSIALLQDGTPQAKLLMYDLIEQTGVVEKEVIEKCKADVQEQIDVDAQKKQEKKEVLANIVNTPVD